MKTLTANEKTELWQIRMREISGAIAVSAIFQLVIGATGFVGKLLKIITPLTIVPTVSLVGLTLFQHAGETASKHWGIAVGTSFLLTLFSQVMVNVNVPVLVYRKGQGFQIRSFAIFKLFPVIGHFAFA